jgi:hypothetical protein
MHERFLFKFSLANLLLMVVPVAVMVAVCRLPAPNFGAGEAGWMAAVKVLYVALGVPTACGALMNGIDGMLRALLGMLGLCVLIAFFMLLFWLAVMFFTVVLHKLFGLN